MNNVAQYISYGCSGRNSVIHIGYSSSDTDDSNANDDDDDNDENNGDDEGDSFWRREFDLCKLILCTIGALAMYYNNYIYKEPYMISYNT